MAYTLLFKRHFKTSLYYTLCLMTWYLNSTSRALKRLELTPRRCGDRSTFSWCLKRMIWRSWCNIYAFSMEEPMLTMIAGVDAVEVWGDVYKMASSYMVLSFFTAWHETHLCILTLLDMSSVKHTLSVHIYHWTKQNETWCSYTANFLQVRNFCVDWL